MPANLLPILPKPTMPTVSSDSSRPVGKTIPLPVRRALTGLRQAPRHEEYLAQNILSSRFCIGIRRVYNLQSGQSGSWYVDVIETRSQPTDYADWCGFTKPVDQSGIYPSDIPDD
jgi:hypothetical protein